MRFESGKPDVIPAEGHHRRLASMREVIHGFLDGVIDGATTVMGPHTRRLEALLYERWGRRAVATSSGTESLHFSLRAAGIGPGDEVIVPDMTFAATAFAVNAVGATPVFVDVEPGCWLISPEAIRNAVTTRTKVIIVVHLYGQIAEMDEISAIAAEHGLTVVEDCAQAHEATYQGEPAGSFGDFGCFSVWAGKNAGGLGDGGMVVVKDEETLVAVERLRNLGRDPDDRYVHHSWGSRARLSELDAAVLCHQIPMLPVWNERRRLTADRYDKAFADLPLTTPVVLPGREHAFYKYAVHTEHTTALATHLAERGIQAERVYPRLLSQQPAFADLPHRAAPTPVAEANNPKLLCLPIYPELRDEERHAIIAGVRSFFDGGA
ncbi:DegT/DnrJ/EryC1/StrS family aminotransferase [Saccharopolyspora gloriosae]|uniref:dTDP-4-amino-4,6-dideoxygalactose transaminase n=1 Tax=Saccharopolyspora gloriosae TaxID=455344 RepID=A0A840NKG1_9PSEU|nr:DegT/DnrJ/EryC1/StrS family aminotransferase [Saccharopolyspora gloriosae]MBB5070515.1 dTDP-4-amino-4,6-dideoxygalactose transaminase [Saccharopolyspora gloriosae]